MNVACTERAVIPGKLRAFPTQTSMHTKLNFPSPGALAAGTLAFLLAPAASAWLGPQAITTQVLETFDTNDNEAANVFRRDEKAVWGRDSKLSATSHFPGTGGPGGAFDLVVAAGFVLVVDTTSGQITDATGTQTQRIERGFVDLRNLWIQQGATLRFEGAEGVLIAVSGSVRIDGTIDARGRNNPGVVTFATGMPQEGSEGGPGGGRGGDGHPTFGQSSPAGENGYGAFGLADGGGGGGESGFNGTSAVDARRAAGGGGGVFARAVPLVADPACPDQSIIGLDAESGAPGGALANGALQGAGQRPRGGALGAGPFADANDANDFWGRMQLADGTLVEGELPRPWAGAGGGGGGDACNTSSFPTTPYTAQGDELGAGGGGGGGSVVIFALGDIVFGPIGRIDASGGTGGGGENTSGLDRVGGASGGGSGGHVVLQTLGKLDLREVVAGPTPFSGGGIYALGGQGGEGAQGVGGANPGGVPTPPAQDMLPENAYGPGASCPVAGNSIGVVPGCGGDGGPGVVQIHLQSLGDLLAPTSPSQSLARIVKPNPVGSTPANVDQPLTWNRLLPKFGPISRSQSEWYGLGGVFPFELRLDGTLVDGTVRTNGDRVARLAPIASGVLGSGPGGPYVVNAITLLVPEASFTDTTFFGSPALMREFDLQLVRAGVASRFDVAVAVADPLASAVRLVVNGSPVQLTSFGPGDTFELRPRFFRVETDGVRDYLPASASIKIELQGAADDGFGNADETTVSPWVGNAAFLQGIVLEHVRFRVTFDLAANAAPLTLTSPRPSLEFLRIVRN